MDGAQCPRKCITIGVVLVFVGLTSVSLSNYEPNFPENVMRKFAIGALVAGSSILLILAIMSLLKNKWTFDERNRTIRERCGNVTGRQTSPDMSSDANYDGLHLTIPPPGFSGPESPPPSYEVSQVSEKPVQTPPPSYSAAVDLSGQPVRDNAYFPSQQQTPHSQSSPHVGDTHSHSSPHVGDTHSHSSLYVSDTHALSSLYVGVTHSHSSLYVSETHAHSSLYVGDTHSYSTSNWSHTDTSHNSSSHDFGDGDGGDGDGGDGDGGGD